MLETTDIMELLPHRYPFLLVDRIIEHEPGKSIVGIKNVTINEPFFPGHFPGHPVMPGVLIIEAMAQVGGVFGLLTYPEGERNRVTYFTGIDNARFRKPVIPGDQLRLELLLTMNRRGIWGFNGKAYVGEKLVAEADLMATFGENKAEK
ncbi:MAG TPA: 3-hydroxyacyl-ACP dehydratase FabZ [Geobacterales bacterium]|nr:3-hydroxyacyl-ACP dehydratase FabZ [Geobacterales bacterium]